jgi:hypothetical protein
MFTTLSGSGCGRIVVRQCFGPFGAPPTNDYVAVNITIDGAYVGGTPPGSQPSEETTVDFEFTNGQELAITENDIGVAQTFALYLGPCVSSASTCPAWETVSTEPVTGAKRGAAIGFPAMSVSLSTDGAYLAVGEPAFNNGQNNDGRVRM